MSYEKELVFWIWHHSGQHHSNLHLESICTLLGPGLYDIHSPVVPTTNEIAAKLRSFLQVLNLEQTVVNPDCGLKTRDWPETIAALRNMVEATNNIRRDLGLASAV